MNIKKFKNNIIIELVKAIVLIVLSSCVGIILLTCVFLLPLDNIEKNAENSAKILEKEGPFPALAFAFTHTLDNDTDSLMIVKAQDDSDHSPFNKALMVYSHEKGTGFEYNIDAIINHYSSEDNVKELQYSRYWHGYLILLKPLLELFNIMGIRILNAIIQLVLMLLVCYFLNKRNLRFVIPPFLISYLLLKPVCTFMCMQFSSCFYILMIGILLVLCKPKWINSTLIFSIIGILTVYFDLLTYPIVTYCFPATIIFSYSSINNKRVKILELLKLLAFWMIGYFGMWAAKWGLVTVFTDMNCFTEAFNESTMYLNMDVSQIYNLPSMVLVSLSCMPRLTSTAILYSLMLLTPYTIIVVAYVIKKIKVRQALKNNIRPHAIIDWKTSVLICIIPAIWYILTYGHAFIHFGFTYKAAIASIFTLMVIVSLITVSKSKAINKNQ